MLYWFRSVFKCTIKYANLYFQLNWAWTSSRDHLLYVITELSANFLWTTPRPNHYIWLSLVSTLDVTHRCTGLQESLGTRLAITIIQILAHTPACLVSEFQTSPLYVTRSSVCSVIHWCYEISIHLKSLLPVRFLARLPLHTPWPAWVSSHSLLVQECKSNVQCHTLVVLLYLCPACVYVCVHVCMYVYIYIYVWTYGLWHTTWVTLHIQALTSVG